MDHSFWNILHINPTKDIKIIRKAYASLSKSAHPEENPQAFLHLKNAYLSAMAYAQTPDKQEKKQAPLPKDLRPKDTLAFRRFCDLYAFAHAPQTWKEFFSSDLFLDQSQNQNFHIRLLKEIKPPYNFVFLKLFLQLHPNHPLSHLAEFPPPTPEEQAFADAYQNYLSLWQNPQSVRACYSRFALQTLQDKAPQGEAFLLHYLRHCPIEQRGQIVEGLNLFHTVPPDIKAPFHKFSTIVENQDPQLFIQSPLYYKSLLRNLEKQGENTSLQSLFPFFRRSKNLEQALYDTEFVPKLQNIIEQSQNPLFLSKLLELFQNHPKMIHQAQLVHIITQRLWNIQTEKGAKPS